MLAEKTVEIGTVCIHRYAGSFDAHIVTVTKTAGFSDKPERDFHTNPQIDKFGVSSTELHVIETVEGKLVARQFLDLVAHDPQIETHTSRSFILIGQPQIEIVKVGDSWEVQCNSETLASNRDPDFDLAYVDLLKQLEV